jgi:hypothetical protein
MRRPYRGALVADGIVLLGLCFVAAAVSISDGLPAEWGKGFAGPLTLHSDPHDTLTGWLTWRGTAMAPPLVILVVLAVSIVLAAGGRRARAVLLAILGAAATVGYLGEPVTRRVLITDFELGKAVVVAAQVVCALALALLGARVVLGSTEA